MLVIINIDFIRKIELKKKKNKKIKKGKVLYGDSE